MTPKRASVVVVVGLFALALAGWIAFKGSRANDFWPPVSLPKATESVVTKQLKEWIDKPGSYKHRITQHAAFDDYLNYGTSTPCEAEDQSLIFDENGAALQWNAYTKVYAFSPVMAAQCGLKAIGAGNTGMAQAQIRGLLSSQNAKGGFADAEPYSYYLTGEVPAGGVSGMSQGQTLSLFARAYHQTGDQRLLEAGKRAVALMGTPVKDGGVMATMSDIDPSLSNYIMFEEVPTTPSSHILNGFMFALLGLYDWSQVSEAKGYGAEQAADLFHRGMETLEKTLPYYDIGRLSSYDLGYITYKTPIPRVSVRYHAVHVYLLYALQSITGSKVLLNYRDKWESDLTHPQL